MVLLEVVQDEVKSLSLLTVVSDGDGWATADLAGDALLVVLALAEPLAQLSSLLNLEERDVVGLAESLLKICLVKVGWTYSDELLVLGVFAVLSENAEEGFLAVECLANLVQSFHQTYYPWSWTICFAKIIRNLFERSLPTRTCNSSSQLSIEWIHILSIIALSQLVTWILISRKTTWAKAIY